MVELHINGVRRTVDALPTMPLLWAVSDLLGLHGTKFGCGIGACGACTVHVGGEAVRACITTLEEVAGKEVTTIEGLAKNGELHPIQQGFWEKHGLQCGFCTPGMIMTACQMLERYPTPTEEQIRHQLEGNLCRCTGYHNIVKAIQWAAEQMAAGKK